MNPIHITHCPGTLAKGYSSYSTTCLRRVFDGKKVHHILPYASPASNQELFHENHQRISISGVQEKFSMILDKNKLRLVAEGEQGTHILKPVPQIGKNTEYMPANEHLTMQIARQLFGVETAENALIFFESGLPAYITKRFDVQSDGSKHSTEDFATLLERTPQTHGKGFKYLGNYYELFNVLKKYVPAYKIEELKLYKLLLFNYLFSNGDAHIKNFSLIETVQGDFKLSPAYDLLNTRIHIEDADFALEEGLLPKKFSQGTVRKQFELLAEKVGVSSKQVQTIFDAVLSKKEQVESLISASFLNKKLKRNYLQAYLGRWNKLSK